MKNFNKVIEARAKEILRIRRIKFILDFISKSKTSVTQELEDFGFQSQPIMIGRKSMNKMAEMNILHNGKTKDVC
jgi:methylphosphotriester-DNA--protein-cysteine methyltransferase